MNQALSHEDVWQDEGIAPPILNVTKWSASYPGSALVPRTQATYTDREATIRIKHCHMKMYGSMKV